MNKYEKSNLVIHSDFEIRKLREENSDIDLLIPLDLRVVNLHINNMPEYISDRFQLIEVRNIIIRFTDDNKNNYCTIHFLKNIDLQSAIVNFTMDYKNHSIKIAKADYSVEMYIL
ncbi:hypothetical protein Curi_c04980 [Gottschalkia acidurici 9a]|uniref:Uncharacterized protein n=1 Tax=Gottschalkia acidurici (strain ATCC 7906 / DSM 604 / BCRC 14475 / CIP 104303 / KCTC 5404 / NCIMB 10678 / 9a) TaxID=1128398 RepID=K0AUL5_GOTA9|nr:hypothetical protein [Gottschalkia acidurici]AFS77573.1 hypothetical protein Curi_c04980 [Gottschalkia acidurici 9a]